MRNNNNYKYIYLSQWVAPEGAARLVRLKESILKAHFPPWLIDELLEDAKECIRAEASATWGDYLKDLGLWEFPSAGRGFYDCLWELSRTLGTGFVIDMESLPLHQMAVEVCEYLGEDIFELSMEGSSLIAAKDKLDCSLPNLTRIGHLTADNNKLLQYKDHITFITPPERRDHGTQRTDTQDS